MVILAKQDHACRIGNLPEPCPATSRATKGAIALLPVNQGEVCCVAGVTDVVLMHVLPLFCLDRTVYRAPEGCFQPSVAEVNPEGLGDLHSPRGPLGLRARSKRRQTPIILCRNGKHSLPDCTEIGNALGILRHIPEPRGPQMCEHSKDSDNGNRDHELGDGKCPRRVIEPHKTIEPALLQNRHRGALR